jgi:hypothetical protein
MDKSLGVGGMVLAAIALACAVVAMVVSLVVPVQGSRTTGHSPPPSNVASDVAILLTCTVRPQDTVTQLRQKSPTEREAAYKTSILRWLTQSPFRIVVVENSGFPMSTQWLGVEPSVVPARLEFVLFDERALPAAGSLRKTESKGAHELFAIHKALLQSNTLRSVPFIIKVTGRFFVPDLYQVLVRHRVPNDYNAVRQHDPDECQILGCKTAFANVLFAPTDEYVVERTFRARLAHEPWAQFNTFVLPVLNIPPTKTGGSGMVIRSL